MELFALGFILLLFYIELSFQFCITWILQIENPKIESFLPSAELALDNIYIYTHIHGDAHGVMAIIIRNGHSNPSSSSG